MDVDPSTKGIIPNKSISKSKGFKYISGFLLVDHYFNVFVEIIQAEL